MALLAIVELIVEIKTLCDKLSEASIVATLVAIERATESGAPPFAVDCAAEINRLCDRLSELSVVATLVAIDLAVESGEPALAVD